MSLDVRREEEVREKAPLGGGLLNRQDGVLLSIRDLRVWFELKRWGFLHAGYVRAVDGVNFDLHRGEAIGIVGESGCGKTTLMKTILGLCQPTGGEVTFAGREVEAFGAREMRSYRGDVGYVQQDPYGALPPFMDVQGILEEPMKIHGVRDAREREQRVRDVMAEVKMTPIEDYLDKFPHMLSGGQQQRVVIARAMILEPQLIVADEPVSMLDASVRVEILRLLQGLQASHNLAVIYITHDLSTVRYFSEHIFVMYAAKLVERARVNELLANPLHPYTEALADSGGGAAQSGESALGMSIPSPVSSQDRRSMRCGGTAGFRAGAGPFRGLLASPLSERAGRF